MAGLQIIFRKTKHKKTRVNNTINEKRRRPSKGQKKMNTLADLNYFYTEKLILWMSFRIPVTPCAFYETVVTVYGICESLIKRYYRHFYQVLDSYRFFVQSSNQYNILWMSFFWVSAVCKVIFFYSSYFEKYVPIEILQKQASVILLKIVNESILSNVRPGITLALFIGLSEIPGIIVLLT